MNKLELLMLGAIALILLLVGYDAVRISGLKKECRKDRPAYECEAMFRTHDVYVIR